MKRPTEAEFCAETKLFFIRASVIWGEIAGIHDACFNYPYRTLIWRRFDPHFNKNISEINEDVERRPLAFVDRRMAEGDRSAMMGRMRTTRAQAKPPKDDKRRPNWLVDPDAHPRIHEVVTKAIEELAAQGIDASYAALRRSTW